MRGGKGPKAHSFMQKVQPFNALYIDEVNSALDIFRLAVFLGSMLPQYMGLCVCPSKKSQQRCQLFYDMARLHLMAPIDFWQDSTQLGPPISPGWSIIFQGWPPTFFGNIS